ncbi:hypothetical protein [Streptomyces gobiensis]|uniref:hypothetical protein n=1 Tax=Streptomyces gobiensis TaxID=2875706 RepID=UPI001E63BA1B|nr:hypothetical protein [Streptomyces gobiensis]UGY90759.1 hypothetical protein test1122_02805 [Streptomyces gobiensis]
MQNPLQHVAGQATAVRSGDVLLRSDIEEAEALLVVLDEVALLRQAPATVFELLRELRRLLGADRRSTRLCWELMLPTWFCTPVMDPPLFGSCGQLPQLVSHFREV